MKTKYFLGFFLAFVISIGSASSAQAEGFSYDLNHVITIGDDLSTTVETNISATPGAGASVPGTINVPQIGSSPTNLAATDSDGVDIPVTEADGALSLRLNSIQAQGADAWNVTINYTSTTGLSIGASTLFMVPPFSYGEINIASEQVSIISGGELGTFVTRGAQPDESTTSAGNFVNTWRSETSELTSGFGLLFGDNALSNVKFSKTLQNDSYWWQTQSVVLPPDTNQQKVFISDISPAPRSVRLDEDGNIIVEFRLRPRQSLEVNAELQIAVNSYTYALDSALLVNDIDQLLIDRYTDLNDSWADTSLTFEAVETTAVAELVKQIYDKVSKEYAQTEADNPYNAAIVRSNALIGELRANGIPSRLVIGAVFGDGGRAFANPQPSAWAEVHIPDVGWITVDPNFEQNGDYFGVADVQRIALALRGFDPEYPPENSTSFNIEFSPNEPPAIPVMKPEITATKHMILPGFSINSVDVTMPGGVIVDNAGIAVGANDVMQLGSLAPLQKVNFRSTSLLAAAFTSESVQYGVFSSGELLESEVIAQATMNVSYLPMIILIVFAFAVFIFSKFIWPRIRERRGNNKPKKEKESRNKLKMSSDNKGEDIENVDMLEALDLPDDEPSEESVAEIPSAEAQQTPEPQAVESPKPVHKLEPEENPVHHVTDLSTAKPVTEQSPDPVVNKQLEPMSLETAHQATPEEIRREMQKKAPKKLIQ